MNWYQIIGIAFGLAMDAFAVAIVSGLAIENVTGRHVFRISWHFGLFQFLMPIVGWFAGRALYETIAPVDHWISFGLLSFVGGKMLYDALGGHEASAGSRRDPSRGLMLVSLSLATSLDALAVGLSMALMDVSIWLPSLVIGFVAGGMSLLGITLGGRIGQRWSRRSEFLGAVVLLAIGVSVLVRGLLEVS